MADPTNTIQRSPVSREAPDLNYWIEERIRATKPITLGREPMGELHPITPIGPPGHVLPEHGPVEKGFEPLGTLNLNTSGGGPVATPLSYPYRTCGRLFFNQGGGGFSGSASLISPNVLLTAGHCVFNTGVWSTNMVFYPSYPSRASNDPAYNFAGGVMACWTAWQTGGSRAYDYGMVWIGANPAPGNLLGWLGLMWNGPTSGVTWDEVGYPGEPAPFNGNAMDGAQGTYAQAPISGTIGLTVDKMGHGSSGSPYITSFNNEVVPVHANSVKSYIVADPPVVGYGPYFTADVQTLFNYISSPANH